MYKHSEPHGINTSLYGVLWLDVGRLQVGEAAVKDSLAQPCREVFQMLIGMGKWCPVEILTEESHVQ